MLGHQDRTKYIRCLDNFHWLLVCININQDCIILHNPVVYQVQMKFATHCVVRTSRLPLLPREGRLRLFRGMPMVRDG
eukprot:SAG31_NODE_3814_length_3859_cov_5.598936_3_plen_78_part_00